MALKKCKECGHKVSKSAKSCPSCGAKLKMGFFKKLMIAFIGLIVLGAIASPSETNNSRSSKPSQASNKSEVKKKKAPKPVVISASALSKKYKANEISADESYKGKVLEVTGSVGSIKKDILGSYFITLNTGDLISSIQCSFDDSFTKQLVKLKKGQRVTVIGECNGLMMNVQLRDCRFK